MTSIAFLDLETEPRSRKILDIGAIKTDGSKFHRNSVSTLIEFLRDVEFIGGHNIIQHDITFISEHLKAAGLFPLNIIDTLYLSPLLFPTKPYHALVKDDKLQTDELSNPLNDAVKANELFQDEVSAFMREDDKYKIILYILLFNREEFQAFFRYIGFTSAHLDVEQLIRVKFANEICEQVDLSRLIRERPIAFAYALSLLNAFIEHCTIQSITPPWVLRKYPDVEAILLSLRNKPCVSGCSYCRKALDIHAGLNKFFGFSSFRSYEGEPLQENAVKAAVDGKSLLAVFPTGGGKSITFQLPALMSGENARGLTIIISPLQSLMKDQVDNLERAGIVDAVTINGLLDPIERAKSFERVEDGSASLLYLSPESLRSKSIERIVLGRKVVRFVIDEAHCFSSWGQDFRVDYLYIGDFIKQIQEKKNLAEAIPVSCFTATAKQKVIQDIVGYFKEKLGLQLQLFTASATRKNLHYKVFELEDEESKYQALRNLIEEKNCPTIVYVSRTNKAYILAERLNRDGYLARPYHGRMDVKEKSANQDAFTAGEVSIMVATSAFGMGVDKKDVGMVVHFEISDSLENYIQEAGRAGRDEAMDADCFVLFNEEDLSKHFIMLNQTKLSIKEIQQVWRAIKEITRFRSTVSNSALEIARKAGWEDNVREIETRVKTAIAALEDAGYLKRGQNMPRVFADSILLKNMNDAIDRINGSNKFEEKQKKDGVRIIKKLYSTKGKQSAMDEVAESRVDYISDQLGIVKEEVIGIVNLLREEKVLGDAKDLKAFFRRNESVNRSAAAVETFGRIETFLLPLLDQEERIFNLKELNEAAEARGIKEVTTKKLRIVLNFWAIKHWVKRQRLLYSNNHMAIVLLYSQDQLEVMMNKRHQLARFIVDYLFARSKATTSENEDNTQEILVEFSVLELKTEFEKVASLFSTDITSADVEDALLYLTKIEAIKLEGGFLVTYNGLTIERLEPDNKVRYKVDDYQKLSQYYDNKVQQIHIVGEYAKKMIGDYKDALQFVEDYFQLNYQSFLNRYFKGSREQEIRQNITPAKFRQLFGELSPSQLRIINDKESKYIVVAAGPGSGKTRVLVHKLASLLLMEDVKHEQLLMLTFSRAAATEFKKRLIGLVGGAANFIEIRTFHAFCFDLLGKVGTLDKSDQIIRDTVEKIRNKEVELSRITKTVLVIDEAQDMNEDEYSLVVALMELNEEMRVIAVGDDDQNIFAFRGASSKYLVQFIQQNGAVKHELLENYRSTKNIVEYSNQWVGLISNRLKSNPIVPKLHDNGKMKLVRYQSSNLSSPLVSDIMATGLKGSTCVLTATNDQAMQISGLLLRQGVQAQLIQSNENFSLYNLLEIRFFLHRVCSAPDAVIVVDDDWERAKRELRMKFQRSSRLAACLNLIRDFEAAYPKRKYKTDLEQFVRESKLEDFLTIESDTIYVSTIHKAKGKEFDNIFLMLQDFKADAQERRRLLYVAMTRAKRNLFIHTNGSFLDGLATENLERVFDFEEYSAPEEIAMTLGYRDVFLSNFQNQQYRIGQLESGESLKISETGCLNSAGYLIVQFSKKFVETVKSMDSRGYKVKGAKVNFIIYWKGEEMDREVLIVLPEVVFGKTHGAVSQ
ncbi:MAG: RecQ family ATP-dependent DNA helicase [Cryomorphaceae bacterium]|nr:RecQ family ATP-dependent DNA helicase [Cryomorphaceae bacterium]